MIDAAQFVEAARERGFDWYTGVPCSFLTPFINYVINDPSLTYVSSANEGDAIASAAGATIGGKRAVVMLQNSGLGNAVSPLTSLANVFRIPLLVICTHRGAPGLNDEPQHALMGAITDRLFDTMEIPWEYFPDHPDDIDATLERAEAFMASESRPYALLMKKGAVAPHALQARPIPAPHLDCRRRVFYAEPPSRRSRAEVLRQLVELVNEQAAVLIATTGFTGRELYALGDNSNQLYMVGSMGCASSLSLGLAMARPDLSVTVIDGDGAALMRMGNFATLGAYGAGNLTHLVLDNEAHDSTGAQATVSSNVAFADIAAACGYGCAYAGDEPTLLNALFACESTDRPRFGHLKITTGTIKHLPRPKIAPADILTRLKNHIGSSAQ